MPENSQERKQKTAKGLKIPVPRTQGFTDALKKIAPPVKPKRLSAGAV